MRPIKSNMALALLATVLGLVACANQMEPAQQALSRAEAAVNAATPDAEKYQPQELASMQSRLADLKTSFDKKDYQTVLTNAPTVEKDASELAQSAATKKTETVKALESRWSDLAGSVAKEMDAVKARVDELGKLKAKRVPKGIDLASAKTNLADADTSWQQAQASHTAGDLGKALDSARDAKGKLDAASGAVKLDVPAASGPGR